jgi:myosin heavy subunit
LLTSEKVEQLRKELDAERNAKTQDATRLQNKIDKIEKELEEAKKINDNEQAAHNKLRTKLSEAKEENNYLSKAMEQMKIDMEQKKAEELADKAKSFEIRLKEAEKHSRNLEAEKKRAEDRNHSLIKELHSVKEQAKERAKIHDQEIQDLRYEIQHEPEVDVRSDSATSPQPLNITIEDSPGDITSQSIEASPRDVNVMSQSTHTVEASPQDIKASSQPSASVFASPDVSMLDLPSAQDPINGEITTVAQMDLPNSNLPPHDSPETVDVLMIDPSPMEPLSGSTKDGDHPENSNMINDASMDPHNSGQIIQSGDNALLKSVLDLRLTCDESLNPTQLLASLNTDCGGTLPNEQSAPEASSNAGNGDARKDSTPATISLPRKHSNDVTSLKSSSGPQRSKSSLPLENPGKKAKQIVPQPADGNDAPTRKSKKAADHALATQDKTIPETYAEQSRGHIHLRFLKQPKRKTSAGSTKRHKKLSLQFCSRHHPEPDGHVISLHSLRDIPQLCNPKANLDFSPNIIRLVSRCDSAKLSPADMEELTRLLQEIADHKNIPPSDDDELIRCLLGDIQLGQDHRSSSKDGLIASLLGGVRSGKYHRLSSKYDGELSIAHMLSRKLELAKDEKYFLTMLYYSVLAVYKYRTRDEGEDQVNILQ